MPTEEENHPLLAFSINRLGWSRPQFSFLPGRDLPPLRQPPPPGSDCAGVTGRMESSSFKSEQEAVGIEKHHFFTGTVTIPEGLPHLGPVLRATEKARLLEPGWGGMLWPRVEGSGTAPRECDRR